MGYTRDIASPFNVHSAHGLPAASDKKWVFLMNRIRPSGSGLYIANAEGTNTHKLLGNSSHFDYHATFSADGKWVLFTTERNRDGNSDIYRVRVDGTDLERLQSTSSIEDAVSMFPDGKKIAYASSEYGYKVNI